MTIQQPILDATRNSYSATQPERLNNATLIQKINIPINILTISGEQTYILRSADKPVPVSLKLKDYTKLCAYIALYKSTTDALDAEYNRKFESMRQIMNLNYDQFVANFGDLHSKSRYKLFQPDKTWSSAAVDFHKIGGALLLAGEITLVAYNLYSWRVCPSGG